MKTQNNQFSHIFRKEILTSSEDQIYDVFIIGGGINGAGVAREATLAGHKTILCEMNDYASGTSSKSSRMLHGGLRYLQYGKIKLVREALHERNLLLSLCPNITKKQRFIFPVFNSFLFQLKLKIGLVLYDLLSGKYLISKHKYLSKNKLLSKVNIFEFSKLKCGFEYSDVLVDDAILTISTISTSVVKHGLHAVNYCKVIFYNFNNNLWEIKVEDILTKNIHSFKAKTLISCCGAWTDKSLVRPTKGIHIVVKRDILPIHNSIVIPTTDGRILFLNIKDEYVYIGTTDTDYKDDINEVEAHTEDVNYLLNQVNQYLNGNHQLKMEDIISTWAGLRPLVNEKGNVNQVSREDKILVNENNLITILGGKLTTFRTMAQRVVIQINKILGGSINKTASKTEEIEWDISNLNSVEEYVNFYIKQTMAMQLTDIMLRRSDDFMFSDNNSLHLVDEICYFASKLLQWDKNEIEEQKKDYQLAINKMKNKLNKC